jgi:glucose-1-phosphate thymidylyltransferase
MKGIILAGGLGSRLYPMTRHVSKQLLPIFNKPMVYYPLSTLMLGGINDILLITTPHDLPHYQALLGTGEHLGIRIQYIEQSEPLGLAQAFILGEEFIGLDDVCLILGDNFFYGPALTILLEQNKKNLQGAVIFAHYVSNPERYGVIAFDDKMNVTGIVEKPAVPPSSYIVTGIYFYDHHVVEIAKGLKPSARNELEITDVNNAYLQAKKLKVQLLGRGYTWFDAGTPQSLLEASQFVAALEKKSGLQIANLEEIAWRRGYITTEQLIQQATEMKDCEYGQYLKEISKVSNEQLRFDILAEL